MRSSLPPREREIVDILYERGPSTVSEIGAALSDALTGSAISAMLKRLEAKGFVARIASDRGFLHATSVEGKAASKSALSQVVRVFLNGSLDRKSTRLHSSNYSAYRMTSFA